MKSDIKTGIRQFILKKFPLARKQQIEDSTVLLESGVLDSMGVLDVVAFLEKEYSISVSDDDLVPEYFQTIECLATFVELKIAARV